MNGHLCLIFGIKHFRRLVGVPVRALGIPLPPRQLQTGVYPMTRCGNRMTIYRHHCRDILSSRWRCKLATHDDSIPCTLVPIISAEARLLAVTIAHIATPHDCYHLRLFRFVRYLPAFFVPTAGSVAREESRVGGLFYIS